MKSREGKKIMQIPIPARKTVLALGSQTKNTVCLFKGSTARISPVHNNLLDPDDLQGFETEVRCLLRQKPRVIACDMHRDIVFSICLHPPCISIPDSACSAPSCAHRFLYGREWDSEEKGYRCSF